MYMAVFLLTLASVEMEYLVVKTIELCCYVNSIIAEWFGDNFLDEVLTTYTLYMHTGVRACIWVHP